LVVKETHSIRKQSEGKQTRNQLLEFFPPQEKKVFL